MFVLPVVFLSLAGAALSAPVARQANPCFVTGSVALPKEVSDGLAALSGVTCDNSVQVVPGVPNVSSGGVKFSDIDFQKSNLSPLGFALQTFATPADPATADLALLQNQLNDYLAVEAGARSQQTGTSGIVSQIKSPKFFLQFQMARAKTALGQQLGVADTVEHQLEKVIKNAVGATDAEKAQVQALATQL
ncbi:hypothetical protein V5O48_002294 [Marasmius crinis-equi]|uniref:DUF7143 domain-containing protein n=1 Tax=Marasmius crinis-equi TaxID=585013 RepID=A0ABR3FW38_9AGAR